MGLSRDINKLSLISRLLLLESLDKMVKSLKFMLQSQVSKFFRLYNFYSKTTEIIFALVILLFLSNTHAVSHR